MITPLRALSLFLVGLGVNASPAHNQIRRSHNSTLIRRNNGPATFYDITAGPVACDGSHHQASEYVVAMNADQFQGSCGKTITIEYGGKSTTATVVDRCESCGSGCDLTEGLFTFFAPLSVGSMNVNWFFGSAPKPSPSPPTTTWSPKPTHSWTPPAETSTSSSSSSTWSSSSSSSSSKHHKSSSSASSSSTSTSATPTPTADAGPSNVVNVLQLVAQMGELIAEAASGSS